MDERLRQLERRFDVDSSGDNAVALLREYARSGKQSQGDIKVLELMAASPDWHRMFDSQMAETLVEVGYIPGIYFNLEVSVSRAPKRRDPRKRTFIVWDSPKHTPTPFPSLEQVCKSLYKGLMQNIINWQSIISDRLTIYQIDSYLVGPSREENYQEFIDNQENAETANLVAEQLGKVDSATLETILQYSSIITSKYHDNIELQYPRDIAVYRIFIPATFLERALWSEFIPKRRVNLVKTSSKIDWDVKNQVLRAQKALFNEVFCLEKDGTSSAPYLSMEPSKFGMNLLLGLSCYYPFRKDYWLPENLGTSSS